MSENDDTKLLDWLDEQTEAALVRDSNGRWVFSSDAVALVPDPNDPGEIVVNVWVDPVDGQPSVRAAIRAGSARAEEKDEVESDIPVEAEGNDD